MTPAFSDPFDHSYENEAVNDLIITLRSVAGLQRVHTAFQGPLSEYVTQSDELIAVAAELEIARDAALGLAPAQLAIQNALVAKGHRMLKFNAHHVVMVSQHRNDPNVLENAGYLLKHHLPVPKVNLLDMIPNLSLKHGPIPESVIVIIKRAKSKASVQLQMTETPDDEQSWRDTGEGTYNRCRNEIRGLGSAKKLYFRGRYHLEGAVGHWSPPISIIVL